MKRVTFILCIVLSLVILTSCASSRTNKDEIIDLFRKNESLIAESIESGDFSEVEKLGGHFYYYEAHF